MDFRDFLDGHQPGPPPEKRKPFVRVRRLAGRWFVFCDACDGEWTWFFRPLRRSSDGVVAARWAHDHARRHVAAMCPVCQHMSRIEDNTTKVGEAA